MSAQRPRLSIDSNPLINHLLARIAAHESIERGRRVTVREVVLRGLRNAYAETKGDSRDLFNAINEELGE